MVCRVVFRSEQSLSRFISPEETREFTAALREVVERGVTRNARLNPRSASGEVIPTTLNASALRDPDGHVIGAIGILHDMRAYERVVRDLERSRSELQEKILDLEKFEEAVNDGIDGCIAGKAMFNVDNRMVVSKCVEFNEEEPCGNLRTDSMEDVLDRLRGAHARNTCTACWYSCRGEVEVLYTPRGFFNSMHSFLYQSRGRQRSA